jgi:excisionase family DNA binding protein
MAEGPRRHKRGRTQEGPPGDGRGPRVEAPRLALTTGEAARHCLVSPDTIANWIASGHLAAQRTRGGQYRIWVDDLRTFMAAHGMRTDLLDHDLGLTPTCWEFWASLDQTSRCPHAESSCDDCPVYRSRADVCHEVRPLLPGGTLRAPSCVDCIYFATVRGVEP